MNDFMGNKERKQQKEKRIKEVCTYGSENGQSTKIQNAYLLDILFSSNHNIHTSSNGFCFWASDPLMERFL